MDQLPIDDILIHVRDTLATDGRVGELGLEVACEDDVVIVRGAISTETRQAEVCSLVTEVLATFGCERVVRDATHVTSCAAPDREPEQL